MYVKGVHMYGRTIPFLCLATPVPRQRRILLLWQHALVTM